MLAMKKKVLILSYSHLGSDPRVMRQIEALQEDFEVEVSGHSFNVNSRLKFYSIYKEPPFSFLRKLKRLFQFITRNYDAYYWDAGKKALAQQLEKNKYDVVIANDIHTLPMALVIAGTKGKVYFDAHEYHPLEFENSFKWRLLHQPFMNYLCVAYIPKAHAFSTVSEGIAKEYERKTGALPFLLTNSTSYNDLQPSKIDQHIKLIHHGAAIPARKLELMIEMMKYTDKRFTLDLMLISNSSKYLDELKNKAKNIPSVKFVDPVPFAEISKMINHYDLGIILVPPTNFNYKNGLPNKLFEFIQARLGIASGPTPEIKACIQKYKLGIVADDFSATSMAVLLNNLTDSQIMNFKENSNKAARILSAEENMRKINEVVSVLAYN